MMKLAIVGAGIAGSACAWSASRLGAEVVVIGDRSGASELYPGVIDLEPWERGTNGAIPVAWGEFVTALDLWVVEKRFCHVATAAGVVRTARGRDHAVLDLASVAGKHVAVADVIRDDWDGELVTRALGASLFAKETGTRFSLVPLPITRDHERSISAWDFAHSFDDETRLGELARVLTSQQGDHDAWLLGPWLGTERAWIRKLRERVRVPIGETTSRPGGTAGARFEAARDELLGKLANTIRVRSRVTALEKKGEGWSLVTTHDRVDVDRVIVAAGGVVAGGIELDGARPDHPGGAAFHLSFVAPVSIELDGLAVDGVSSLHGVDFAARGLPSLERIGIACDGEGVRAAKGLFAAGDVIAGRPRTVLEAIGSGIRAAERALAS